MGASDAETRSDGAGAPGPSPAGAPAVSAGADALRVALVTTSFPRFVGDFAGRFVLSLAEELVARGVDVEVVAPHAAGLAPEETLETPRAPGRTIRVTRFRYAPDALERVAYGDGIPANLRRDPLAGTALPGFARALRRATAEASRRADIVHAQWAPTAALARSSALAAPMVVTLHGSDVALADRGGMWLRLLERGLGPGTAAVIAVSDDLAARLRATLDPAKLPPVTVVPTGVERALLDRTPAQPSGYGELAVAYVGRLLESKGVLDLADATASLPSRSRLVVCGDGPARDGMEARLLARPGGPGTVVWLGAVGHETALDVISGADLVAVPSHAEGAGLVALEASALGTCVVATRTGVMPQLLAEEQLVPPADVAALKATLARLAADAALRERLAEAARDRVAAKFTWDVLAERVEDVYRTVLATGGAR